MLDQRRAQEKGYITLKEAAQMAHYTPDYVGQLIRAGKIKGEQVYSNVAWVTTPEEMYAYMTDKSRVPNTTSYEDLLSQPIFKYALYGLITICAVALLLLQYILYVSIDNHVSAQYLNSITNKAQQTISTS